MNISKEEQTEQELTKQYAETCKGYPIFEVQREFGSFNSHIQDGYVIDAYIMMGEDKRLVEAKKFKVGSETACIENCSYHEGVGQALNYTRETNNVELWHFYCGYDMDNALPIAKNGHKIVQRILNQAKPDIRLRSIVAIDGEITCEVFR